MWLTDWMFSSFYHFLSIWVEGYLRKYRLATAGMVSGDVLEVGAGTGANLPYYRRDINLTLLEPSPAMRKRLSRKIMKLKRKDQVVSDRGEKLPFPDDSFDYVVSTLTLCSVRDSKAVLSEIRRVLRVGGILYFYEHVAADQGITRWFQDKLNSMWKIWAGGCNLNRQIDLEIQTGGFRVVRISRFRLPISPPILRPSIVGFACV